MIWAVSEERRETSSARLKTGAPIPLLTFPLKGEEFFGAQRHSLPFKGRVRVGMGANKVKAAKDPSQSIAHRDGAMRTL